MTDLAQNAYQDLKGKANAPQFWRSSPEWTQSEAYVREFEQSCTASGVIGCE